MAVFNPKPPSAPAFGFSAIVRPIATDQSFAREQNWKIYMPSDQTVERAQGYLAEFSARRFRDDTEPNRVDVTVVLSQRYEDQSDVTTLHFENVRQLRIGSDRDGIAFGSSLYIAIEDIADQQWEGIRFKAINVEQGCPLSLCCSRFKVMRA